MGQTTAFRKELLAQFRLELQLPGELYLRRRSDGLPFLLKEFDLYSKDLCSALSQRQDSACQNLARPVRIWKYSAAVVALFDYGQTTLATEITSRSEEGHSFSEQQLLSIFSCLIIALRELRGLGSGHGIICAQNVVLSAEGITKLLDPLITRVSFDKPWQGRLLAPEELQGREQSEQSDLFSLAMTILQCASLRKSIQLYDFSKKTINQKLLQKRIQSLDSSYGESLATMIVALLDFDPAGRPGIDELEEYFEQRVAPAQAKSAKPFFKRSGDSDRSSFISRLKSQKKHQKKGQKKDDKKDQKKDENRDINSRDASRVASRAREKQDVWRKVREIQSLLGQR